MLRALHTSISSISLIRSICLIGDMTNKSNKKISKTIQKHEETIYKVTCTVCNNEIELFTIGKVSNSAQMLRARSHVSKHFVSPDSYALLVPERFMKVETA